MGLLAIAALHHVAWPGHFKGAKKGGVPLNKGQVLGLGLEQTFKFLLGAGASGGSCSYVVFSATQHPNADANGNLGIPLTLVSQKFLHRLGAEVFKYCFHVGFHILGVDVPYAADISKSFDFVGVLREDNLLGVIGRATMEVFMTSLPWGHEYNERKRQRTIDNLGTAGLGWVAHLMLVITYAIEKISREPVRRSWNLYRLVDGDWTEVLQGVHVPVAYQLSDLQRSFHSIVDYLGKPYNTRGAHGPEYLLRKFLDHPDIAIATDTKRFARSMQLKGIKKGLRFKKGFGSGGQEGKQWLCTAEALEDIFKKIRRG